MNVIYAFIGSHPDYNGVASGKVMGGAQRLSESNGLLLCANHDKLFDHGYISFDCDVMKPFMKYHRETVFIDVPIIS